MQLAGGRRRQPATQPTNGAISTSLGPKIRPETHRPENSPTRASPRRQKQPEQLRAKRYAHCRLADNNLRNGIKRNIFRAAPNLTVLWSETGRAKRYAHCHFWDKSLRTHRLESATCAENLPNAKTSKQQPKLNH